MTITRFTKAICPTHIKNKQIEVKEAEEHRSLGQQGPAFSIPCGYELEVRIQTEEEGEERGLPGNLRSHRLQTPAVSKNVTDTCLDDVSRKHVKRKIALR